MTGQEAVDGLDLSLRHVRRMIASFRPTRSRRSGSWQPRPPLAWPPKPQATRHKILALIEQVYRDYNDHHLTEVLAEDHGITLSRSSLRGLRRSAGLGAPRKHRPPKHRSRRPRFPQPGMLLQIDGSPHPWLEDRGPDLCLIKPCLISTTPPARSWLEDAAGYFLLLRQISLSLGIPLSLHADQHTILQSPKRPPGGRIGCVGAFQPVPGPGWALGALEDGVLVGVRAQGDAMG